MRSGISVDEAQAIVLENTSLMDVETIAATDALDRVLVSSVLSQRNLPPADSSAMDGYAIRARDLRGASVDSPVFLDVVFEVPAGGVAPRELKSGEAARIFTGAPLPAGSDTVVRQEDVVVSGSSAQFNLASKDGEHVREAGEDVREGDRVLCSGDVLRSPEIGMLAALGRTLVSVYQRPRVAILSGGDELVEPDQIPQSGQIVSSNAYALIAACRSLGAETRNLGIAKDTPDALEEHLRAGLSADVVVSTAGVSVGDYDYVRPVLEKLGCEILFWGVSMKPGFPVVFGRFPDRGPLVFGLPGNPVSALVTFEQFVRPALCKLQGFKRLFLPCVEAELAEPLTKSSDRLHLVRVNLDRDRGGLKARSTGNQSSGVLRSMILADGLLIFPAMTRELPAGSKVKVQVFKPDDWLDR